MPKSNIKNLTSKIGILALLPLALMMCAPPPPSGPRPTAATILEITPAPTLNLDATATEYARRLVPSPTPAGLYVVQQGDTLSGLAEDFGTTVEELMAANGLTDPNAIQAGQTLIIPGLIGGAPALGTTAPISATASVTATDAPTATTTLTTTAVSATQARATRRTPTPTLSTP
jgi:LysM repeat protein